MGGTIDAVDRVSDLPDSIIHHIMYYLTVKQVVRTSILSKRWYYLRTSFPILVFDQNLFRTDGLSISRKRAKQFMNFVDVSVIRFCDLKFRMQKFNLFMSLLYGEEKESSSLVDKWIALAVENQVKEMNIEVLGVNKWDIRFSMYTMPSAIFSARFLTTLKLSSCVMKQPTDTIRFDSLRKLTLNEVYLDEKMVRKLTSECPLLEDVYFNMCRGFNCFCVSNLKLKIVRISGYPNELESVEIVCPNIEKFSLLCLFSDERSSMINIDMARSQHLKELDFHSVPFNSQQFHHLISQLPLLEDLRVRYCPFLERVTISSDQLKKLEFSGCGNLKAIDVDTPNLLSFCFMNHIVPISSINAPCPWRVSFENFYDLVAASYITIREFLGQSNQIEDLSIYFQKVESSFNLDQVRELFPSLPREIGNLHLCMFLPPSNFPTWLDGFLWLCFPKTLTLTSLNGNYKFMEESYNELKNRKTNCCNSDRIKCWRHYLKALKIEKFVCLSGELLDVANLTDSEPWLNLPSGCLTFHLDWCYDMMLK